MEDQQLDDPLLDAKDSKPVIKFPSCRHVLAFLAFLGFVNVYALRVNLSVALVAMVNSSATHNPNSSVDTECPGDNTTVHKNETQTGEFDWDSNQQGLILGSFFYGYIFTQIPGGWLGERYGGKRLFGYGVLCTAVFTMVTPLAAKLNVYVLVATRVLEGLGEGVTFPAMHAILAKWAPKYERSKLGTFVYAGAQFGTVISLPISGLLCDYVGWESVFYVFGSLGIVWFIVWMLLTSDSPATHPRISPEERDYIESNIGHDKEEWLPTPWLKIFTSVHVWAIVVAHFCNNWGFYTLLTCLPTYMKEVLHFDISSNGFLSALPYLVMWININVGGQMADFIRRRNYLSTGVVRKLFNGIGFLSASLCLTLVTFTGCSSSLPLVLITLGLGIGGLGMSGFGINHLDIAPPFAGQFLPAIFLIAAGYLGCDTVLAVAMVTLSVGTAGFALSGYQVNHLDIAPPFAGTLLGITNMAATIPGFAGPQVVGWLTHNNSTRAQWRKVFFISSAIYAFGAVVFAIFASGKEQKWAKPEHYEEERRDHARENGVVYDQNDDPLIT